MLHNTNEVSADSSPASSVSSDSLPENAVEVASTTTDVEASPSEEIVNPEQEFNDTVEKLESGSSPKEAIKESKPSPAAKTDEQANGNGEDKALSQDQEQSLNKQFVDRPEWKKVLSAAPKEKQAEVRSAMRTIYERENALHKQIEQQKPVVQTFERFRKGVGDDQAVENTIKLVEFYQAGDPRALQMLDALRNDLLQRTGEVLTSQDLIQRNRSIDDQLTQGTLDEAEATQKRKDLLEIEKARVTAKRSETDVLQRETRELQNSVNDQVAAAESAGNEWEKTKMSNDPDYPALKEAVEARALALANQHPSVKAQKVLTPVEAVKILDDALVWAKAQVAKWQPKAKPRNGLNGNGSSSSATSRRQPANAEEEFNQRIEELESRGGRR